MTTIMPLHGLPERFGQAVELAALERNADIFFLAGNLTDEVGHQFVDTCPTLSDAQNCVLFLTTRGGSMDAAYRITRCVKNRYPAGDFMLVVDGLCKSAGTLIAVGADTLVMTDRAELGPLDTQVRVRDEFGEQQSGLIDNDALRYLNEEVFNSFRGHLHRLLSLGNSELTTQTALRVASELTLGLFDKIYGQVDPIRFGETARAIQIALEYGYRVNGSNVQEGSLRKLATGYPSHGFVIDKRESEDLFYNVYSPNEAFNELAGWLRLLTYYCLTDHESPILEHLNQGVSEHLATVLQILTNGDAPPDDDVPPDGTENGSS